MPKHFILHTILLILSVAGVYFWLTSPSLTPFTLQLVAILVLLYLGSHWYYSHNSKFKSRNSITLDITILTSMILLLVSETGALSSPFFFLCYFLLFAVAMLYEIEATLILTGILALFFMFLPNPTLTQIVSLVMVTPLAIFTSHNYEIKLKEQHHLKHEETDTLLFLSLNLKRTLISALDSLSLLIPQEKVKATRQNLQTLYEDLKNLYRSADELESVIDKETD